MQKIIPTLIIGAGVCGLHLGALLGKSARIIEAAQPARKLLASGGGRCNLTNENILPQRYLGDERHFWRVFGTFASEQFPYMVEFSEKTSVLEKLPPQANCSKTARHFCEQFPGVKFSKIRDQQYFAPSAKLIANAMLSRFKGELLNNCAALSLEQIPGGFKVQTTQGSMQAKRVIIATGTPAFSSLVSEKTNFAQQIAGQFGVEFRPFRPALCELVAQPQDAWLKELSGLSVPAQAHIAHTHDGQPRTIVASLLLTHRGLGGPLGYKCSLWWVRGAILLDFAPGFDGWRSRSELAAATGLSKRLAAGILRHAQLAAKPLRAYSAAEQKRLQTALRAYAFAPAGAAGFARAEIAAGGVAPMAVQKEGVINQRGELIEGLYFAGECLDFSGDLGGFNISHALANAEWLAQILG